MKVDFMIIGAMKAGTTSLYEILDSHPNIIFSKIKEPHFFSNTDNWEKELPQYHKLFQKKEGCLYGEASPSYSAMPTRVNTYKKIYEYNPKIKIIYLIRNPFNRSVSHYMHLVERGYLEMPIEEACDKDPQIIQSSRYYYQIKPYIRLFGKEQVKVIDFADFIKNREDVLKKLSDFLDIDYSLISHFEDIHANPSVNSYKLHPRYDKAFRLIKPVVKKIPVKMRLQIKKLLSNPKRVFKEKPHLPEQYRKKITELIKPEIPELEKLLGKDLSEWIDSQ